MRSHAVIWVLILCFNLVPSTTAGPARATTQRVTQEVLNHAVIEAIREEGLNRSRVADDLRHLSDVIGPRLTGSPSMDRANAWAADRMRTYGLDEVRLEPWYFGRGWEEVSYSGRMTEPFLKPLVGRSVAWAGPTDGALAGQALFLEVDTPAEVDAIADRVRGAWVLLDRAGSDRAFYESDRPARWSDDEVLSRVVEVPRTSEEAQQERDRFLRLFEVRRRLADVGARGFVTRSRFRGGALGWVESILGEEIPPEVLEPGGVTPLPQVLLADTDYALVFRNLQAGVPVTLEFDLRTRFLEDDLQAHNTIGELPGTDLADELVMIGAHLGSWHGGTGALDNGVGSIVALEAMRILATLDVRPRRTIRIGLWSGEEPERLDHSGLFGSTAYVEAHADELDRTTVYFNLDSGTGRIRGIWEQENPEAAAVIAAIMEPLSDLGVAGLKPGFFVGSDDISFAEAGVPAFPFVHDAMDGSVYHTELDTFDGAAIDDLKQAAVVVAVTVFHLATRSEPLPR